MRKRLTTILAGCMVAATAGAVETLSVLTYNVDGNGVADWGTNSAQVQAIGHEMAYLQPDVITFQEIPNTNAWQMPNFTRAFLPGYFLATNSCTDGYIRSVILSRYPITRSQSWLCHASLVAFGYTNSPSTFTRDLFEAEINVPGFNTPVHVFTTHLKAGQTQADAERRTAEASAISNFFATVFQPASGGHPYLVTGDMNDDLDHPSDPDYIALSRLLTPPTGLHLTTPLNAATGSALTWSIRNSSLTRRFDYVLPGTLLFSNILGSQIFRADQLSAPPAPLTRTDAATASDHLPVLMFFRNPFNGPFRILEASATTQSVALRWESAAGRWYQVEESANGADWSPLTPLMQAGGPSFAWTNPGASGTTLLRIYRQP